MVSYGYIWLYASIRSFTVKLLIDVYIYIYLYIYIYRERDTLIRIYIYTYMYLYIIYIIYIKYIIHNNKKKAPMGLNVAGSY